MKYKVYLAGHVFEIEYRKNAHKYYGRRIEFLDPLKENGVILDIEKEEISKRPDADEVVTTDKHLISTCDIFVALINKLTFGTIMEIMYAYSQGKPILVIVPPGKGYEKDIWLSHHTSKFFYGESECFDFIINASKT